MDANKILNGSNGAIWVNGEQLAQVKSFQAKVNFVYEDVEIMGQMSTKRKLMGWNGEGTLVLYKIDSFVLKLYQDFKNTGKVPSVKMISKLDDPNSNGAERISIKGVTLNEMFLANFENKTVLEEELTFGFDDYELLDTIG